MFARVILAMMSRDPIKNPCDHASMVKCAVSVGLDPGVDVGSAILPPQQGELDES